MHCCPTRRDYDTISILNGGANGPHFCPKQIYLASIHNNDVSREQVRQATAPLHRTRGDCPTHHRWVNVAPNPIALRRFSGAPQSDTTTATNLPVPKLAEAASTCGPNNTIKKISCQSTRTDSASPEDA